MRRNGMTVDIGGLPPEAQQQVADFIEFLRLRQRSARAGKRPKLPKLAAEAFVGIWKDRPEMKSSRNWLRRIRQGEWEQGNG